jgi:DegV family protein with EDD domain
MNVGIVTDSACSLPAELVAANEVVIVPMHLNVGDESYLDGELSLEEVVGQLKDGITTSGPGPGEVAKAVRAADRGAGVVVLTVSQQMSSTFSAARLAKMSLEGEHRVAVVDTGTAAGAQGLVVLAASKAARAGETLESVVATAEGVAARVRLLATLPSLAHLARSGRVPGAAAWGAAWLGLNAMFEFRSGKVRPLRPSRSPEAARQRIVEAFVADLGRASGKRAHLAALHSMDKPVAEDLLAQASRWTEPATAFVGSFSSVMIVHTGPGLAGLAWWIEGP